jgi:signal transduction histidine kinase
MTQDRSDDMLTQFLTDNRRELIARCSGKAAKRSIPDTESAAHQEHGIPVFLDQLIAALQSGKARDAPDMEHSATRHGAELLRQEFAIGHVVHCYGDLCQAIMELAIEKGTRIDVAEFGILNQALDNAIAGAVTAYCSGSSALVAERGLRDENMRLGLLTHEMRDQVHTATLALTAIKAGGVGLNGATGALLDRTMTGLRRLIDRSLMEVRLKSPLKESAGELRVADLVRNAARAAALEARATECEFSCEEVDPELVVRGDADVLMSAIGNLLQNAFKFSCKHGEVSIRAYASGDRVLIEVADSCGGLPAGMADRLFQPFVQAGKDRTGLGLGLSIVKLAVEANGGVLYLRDAPPVGCVFTIDLPRHVRHRTDAHAGAPQTAAHTPKMESSKP